MIDPTIAPISRTLAPSIDLFDTVAPVRCASRGPPAKGSRVDVVTGFCTCVAACFGCCRRWRRCGARVTCLVDACVGLGGVYVGVCVADGVGAGVEAVTRGVGAGFGGGLGAGLGAGFGAGIGAGSGAGAVVVGAGGAVSVRAAAGAAGDLLAAPRAKPPKPSVPANRATIASAIR